MTRPAYVLLAAALAAVALLAGLTAPVLTGGYSSIVPLVVPPAALARANAVDSASYNVAGLAGPALVAVLASVAGFGPRWPTVSGCSGSHRRSVRYRYPPRSALAGSPGRSRASGCWRDGRRGPCWPRRSPGWPRSWY